MPGTTIKEMDAGCERAGVADERSRGAARVRADTRSRRARDDDDAAARDEVRRGEAAGHDAGRRRRRRSGADDCRRRHADRRQGGRLRRRRAGRGGAGGRQQFTFEPARKGDQPIPARIRYRYTFDPTPVPAPAAPDAAAGADAAPLPPSAKAAPRPGRLEGRVLAARVASRSPAPPSRCSSEQAPPSERRWPPRTARSRSPTSRPGPTACASRRTASPTVETPETVTANEATAITYRLAPARKSGTEYEFGATASIAAPPREVVKRTLAPDELVRTAGTRGDPLRVIELLPGVARPPGLAGFLIIRGASPFDSQAFFEGGIVDRIYHFGGLTSFVNPRLLDHIDLYPGNFSARFGRKMGGIIDVGIRDPKADGCHVMADVNLIDASFIAEGPVGKRGVVRPRRQAQLHRLLVQQRRPAGRHRRHRRARLLRLPGRLHVPPRERRQGADDVPRLGRRVPPEPEAARRRRSDAAGQLRRRHVVPPPADDLAADAGRARRAGHHRRRRDDRAGSRGGRSARASASTATTSSCAPSGAPSWARTSSWSAASTATRLQVDVVYVGPHRAIDRGQPALLLRPAHRPAHGDVQGLVHDLPSGRLPRGADPGGRPADAGAGRARRLLQRDREGLGQPAPDRALQARRPQTTLKGGVGLFSQAPQYGETVAPIGNPNLGLSQAQHYGLGIEQSFGRVGSVSLEGFYKRLTDLEVNGVGPDGNPLLVNGGKGRIYGLEVLAKLNPTGRAFGFVSYTLSRSERNDYGAAWRLFDFDQTHILTMTGGYELGRGWDFGSTFRLVSGNPRTPIVGSVYDANSDFYNPVYGAVNSARDPLFHQLSVRVEKAWKFKAWQLATYLDVQNVYNHRSQEGLQYSYDYSRSKPVQGLPILPSLGLRGEF